MPLATGTSRFLAKVDFTRCWAQKPSTIGMTRNTRRKVMAKCYPPPSPVSRERDRVFGFLTLRLQRLARGRVCERPLELGLRLVAHVRVLQRGDRGRDRRLERREVGCESRELLEKLRRRSVGGCLRAVSERVVLRLELLRGVVELLPKLVTGLEVRRTEITQLRDELACRVTRLVELVAQRVRRERLAAHVGEGCDRGAPVGEARAHLARPLLGRRRAVVAQAHRDRGDNDRRYADDDRPDEPVPAHRGRV